MDSVLKLLGLCYRANKVLLGENVLDNLSKIRLLILANDMSPKSKERYNKKVAFYKIETIEKYSTDDISMALGRNNVKVVGIIDDGFAKSLIKKTREENNG